MAAAAPTAPFRQSPLRYLGLIRIAILHWLAWRMSSLMKLIDFPVVIGVYTYLFRALYASLPPGQQLVGGLPLDDTLTYIALVWIIESLINNRLDQDMGHEVRDGRIATLLSRPVDLQAYYFFQTLGHVLWRMLMISLPIVIIASTLFRLHWPPTPEAAIAFVVALAGAMGLMFLLNFMSGLMAFFFEWNYGLGFFKEASLRGLGGLLIPLTIFPEAMRDWLLRLPFAQIYFVPVQIWLGRISGEALWERLAWQWGWVLVLLLISRVLLDLAQRKVTLVGG